MFRLLIAIAITVAVSQAIGGFLHNNSDKFRAFSPAVREQVANLKTGLDNINGKIEPHINTAKSTVATVSGNNPLVRRNSAPERRNVNIVKSYTVTDTNPAHYQNMSSGGYYEYYTDLKRPAPAVQQANYQEQENVNKTSTETI
jgi:hypothetical protein